MKKGIVFILGLLVLVSMTNLCWSGEKVNAGPSDYLLLSGTVNNQQGKGVKEVRVAVLVNGKEMHVPEEVVTSSSGSFHVKLTLPRGALPGAKVELELTKASYEPSGRIAVGRVVEDHKDEKGNVTYLSHLDIKLNRAITPAFWIATLVLLGVYVVIAM